MRRKKRKALINLRKVENDDIDALNQCFSTPSPRTQMSPRKALAESTSTMGKQVCCNALRQ